MGSFSQKILRAMLGLLCCVELDWIELLCVEMNSIQMTLNFNRPELEVNYEICCGFMCMCAGVCMCVCLCALFHARVCIRDSVYKRRTGLEWYGMEWNGLTAILQ